MTADQRRQAAIEAGTQAARHKLGTLWPEPMLTEVAREMVVAVIDAAAPHLVGEPVGYAIVYDHGTGPWLQDRRISTSPETARGRRGYLYPYTIVALVPVEVEP